MKVGDIVKVARKNGTLIGVVVDTPKNKFMAPGKLCPVLIDGTVQLVLRKHVKLLEESEASK